jgi:putative phosphoesterase
VKIAVLSDTHSLLRPEVKEIIRQCDVILHAGDIDYPEIIEEMKGEVQSDVPFFIVRGNNDWGKWTRSLPIRADFTLEGVKFSMVHNQSDLSGNLGDCQVVVFGHSHKYGEEIRDGRLWLNPGSCGPRRFRQDVTMAVLTIEKGQWQAERIDLG